MSAEPSAVSQARAVTLRAESKKLASGVMHIGVATVAGLINAYDAAVEERDALAAKVRRVGHVRCWTNEDGKRFLFAEDVFAALEPDLAAELRAHARTTAPGETP